MLHSSRGCGRTRGHGPTCSSEVLHGNQAGIRHPDRPFTPTPIASSFDYQVIFYHQAPHERLLRHRLRPDHSDLFALDCHLRGGDLHYPVRRSGHHKKAKYFPVRRHLHRDTDQTASPLPSAGLQSHERIIDFQGSGFTPCFALALSSTPRSLSKIFLSTSSSLRPPPRLHLPTASPAVTAALPPRPARAFLEEEAKFIVLLACHDAALTVQGINYCIPCGLHSRFPRLPPAGSTIFFSFLLVFLNADSVLSPRHTCIASFTFIQLPVALQFQKWGGML